MLVVDTTNHRVPQRVTPYLQSSAILLSSAVNIPTVFPSVCRVVLNAYPLTMGDGFGLKCFFARVTISSNASSVAFVGDTSVLTRLYMAGPTPLRRMTLRLASAVISLILK